MLPEFGNIALSVAFACAVLQAFSIVPKLRAYSFVRLGEISAIVQAIALIGALAILIMSFAQSDFSVELVAQNSHSTKPLFYKIAGAWGNHEGSMLLWSVLLAIYSAAFAIINPLGSSEHRISVSTLGVISACTIAYLIAASNPFLRLDPAALEGRGLNPLLQDPGLAIHPPVLYAGYVGFAVPYAIAIGLLCTKNFNRTAAAAILPWIFTPVAFMTLGIGLGSWWAYRELGWGGWWFWDPVENASLLPLLIGIALAHTALVWKNRGELAHWTLFLACAAFSLSVFGAFLVRSGVLTSIHSFAVDPARGLLIFSFFTVLASVGLALCLKRMPSMTVNWRSDILSRDTAMFAGILVLVISAATILTGTIYPLVLESVGKPSISVGAPYYNVTVTPIFLGMLMIMAGAPQLRWRSDELKSFFKKMRVPIGALLVTAPITVVLSPMTILQSMLFGFGAACFVAALIAPFGARPGSGYKMKWKRRDIGILLGHGGVAISAIGILGSAFLSEEQIISVTPGDQVEIAGYTLTFHGIRRYEGVNFVGERANIISTRVNTVVDTVMTPERRWYPAAQVTTTEAAIRRTFWADLYVTIGDLSVPGANEPDWALRAYHRPFISWIWAGCLIAFMGAGISAVGFFNINAQSLKKAPVFAPYSTSAL